jgi:hypothetical protein
MAPNGSVVLLQQLHPVWFAPTCRTVALNAGGVVDVLRASFKCQLCDTVAWQLPLDFLQIGAWPASLTDRVKTIVDCELLQQWDSHRLCNATATLSGFLKGVQHAASATSSMLVIVR